MKKFYLLCLLLILFMITRAQSYIPLPDTNAYWNEIKFYQGQCDPPNFCRYTCYFQGDTVLNSLSYHKVYKNDSYEISYSGGLRQDGEKVYYWDRDCDSPVLLYDFGLTVGDSIALACMLCDEEPLYAQVVSVDSVMIGDMSYRKRINFTYGYSYSWIEGIGSVYGLLYPYYSCILCVCYQKLVCFEQDGQVLYLNESDVPCFNFVNPPGDIDPASEWRVDSWTAEPDYSTNSYYRDFIDGDTIINTIRYHKVYQSGYTYYLNYPPGYYYYYEDVFHGLLREEDNRWYTINYNGQDELLYDFTLDVGDTVYSAFTFIFEDPIIVTGVDSVLVGGDYKRRLELNSEEGGGAEYIIEDIGATSGLFENMFFFEWGSELVCFAKNGVSLWGASTEECDLAVAIGEAETHPNACFISPNPATDHLILTLYGSTGEASFTLINLLGNVVMEGSFTSPSINKIDLNTYSPGIYLAVIKTADTRETFKVVKR